MTGGAVIFEQGLATGEREVIEIGFIHDIRQGCILEAFKIAGLAAADLRLFVGQFGVFRPAEHTLCGAARYRPGPLPGERVCYSGDLFKTDSDGYFYFVSRKDDIIKSRGEKVSPREVDEILMDHPAVAQVVCFGMPHPKLGEEVAAAVVLREGQSVTERELQAFVSQRAAEFKVPKTILFMPEIPKGATGKLQRIGLAAQGVEVVTRVTWERAD